MWLPDTLKVSTKRVLILFFYSSIRRFHKSLPLRNLTKVFRGWYLLFWKLKNGRLIVFIATYMKWRNTCYIFTFKVFIKLKHLKYWSFPNKISINTPTYSSHLYLEWKPMSTAVNCKYFIRFLLYLVYVKFVLWIVPCAVLF